MYYLKSPAGKNSKNGIFHLRGRHDRGWIYNYLCNQCPITNKTVSSNPAHDEVYSIQHYVIKIISELRQVYGFLPVLLIPPPITLTATIY